MDVRDLEPVLEVADVIQVGARNMQNYTLLTEIGRSGRPVLLKRGLSATLEELLMAAEYILKEGNERDAVRARHPHVRDRLPLHARPDRGAGAQGAHAPAGDRRPQPRRRPARPREPLSLAAAAVGADGIIVEVHPEPDEAICDGPQAALADDFADYLEKVERAAAVAGKVARRARRRS